MDCSHLIIAIDLHFVYPHYFLCHFSIHFSIKIDSFLAYVCAGLIAKTAMIEYSALFYLSLKSTTGDVHLFLITIESMSNFAVFQYSSATKVSFRGFVAKI